MGAMGGMGGRAYAQGLHKFLSKSQTGCWKAQEGPSREFRVQGHPERGRGGLLTLLGASQEALAVAGANRRERVAHQSVGTVTKRDLVKVLPVVVREKIKRAVATEAWRRKD